VSGFAITVTRTRTHLVITPANPFLACRACGKRVEAFHDDGCGCDESGGPLLLVPCFHRSDYDDLCPSWSPVDGCTCLESLGRVPHPARLALA
jgi:hypothetical protein